jgi:hypothetical protein
MGINMLKYSLSLVTWACLAANLAAAPISFTTAYDHSPSSTNQMRTVAIGNGSAYFGYIQQTGGFRDINRIDLNSFALQNSRPADQGNDQPKTLAIDSSGNVWVGSRVSGGASAELIRHSADLSTRSAFAVASNSFGGIAIQSFGPSEYLYLSREVSGMITRYDITSGTPVLDATFGTGGVFSLGMGSGILRGLEVGVDGTIYVTSREDNKVYRISADLATITSADVTRAMDVAIFDGKIYVTSYNGVNSTIEVFDAATLAYIETITIADLDGNAYTRGTSEGWAGIDFDSFGRLWLTDQAYQTTGGARDRLLVSEPFIIPPAEVPEPASIAVWSLVGVAGLAYRWSRKKRNAGEAQA